MLELVLEDEPEDEPLAQERVRRVEVDVVDEVEHALAHVLRVRPDRVGAKRREIPVRLSLVPERVVNWRRGHRAAASR